MGDICDLFKSFHDETLSIFDAIQKRGPISKNELLDVTGLKLTSLIRFMQPLEETKLIVESEIGESTGGRKPVLYDVNKSGFYIIGIDISRIYTQVVITNLKMDVIGKVRFEMQKGSSPQNTVELIANAVDDSIRRLSIEKKILLGAGLGTVGPLDRVEGIIKNPIKFEAPGWTDVPIKAMLEKKLGCRVIVDNGANAAVLAETYFGTGKGFKNVVYFNCGMGIRTGAISSGSLIRTMNDSEDVFGHMVINVDGEKCDCGNAGCIECYSSIPSIVKKFNSEIKKGRKTTISKPSGNITYIDICNAAENGDQVALKVITHSAAILGAGMANFINLLNPRLIILSGPLINHSTLYYQVCIEAASQKCFLSKQNNIAFCRNGFFQENAISVGSALLVTESLIGNPSLN